MISVHTKKQVQVITDAIGDDPDDVIVGDFWDRQAACQLPNEPDMTPTQWLEFGK